MKNAYEDIWLEVASWHEEERRRGHHVAPEDLLLEFVDRLVGQIEGLQRRKEEVGELSKEDQDRLDMSVRKLHTICTNRKAREEYMSRLLSGVGAKVGRPSRFTELTAEEEEIRCKLTWQSNDRVLYIAAFGDSEELKTLVAETESWRELAPHTVLVYSDQIPFWVSLGLRKTAYARFERNSLQQARKRRRQMKKAGESYYGHSTVQQAQAMPEMDEVQEDRCEGQTQLRGKATDGDDKLRVTFRNRLGIFKFFQEDEVPVGAVLPTVMIVHGSHARLDNIDDEGKWIETEQFYLGETLVTHTAGESARGCLASYVALRKEKPELFKDVIVYSAPAANETTITEVWQTQDLQKRVGQTIHQRDMYSAGLAGDSRKAHQLCQSLSTWIAGKMTPALQLTDTDASKKVQDACREAKMKIMLEQKKAAEALGVEPVYRCDAEQIMELANYSHKALVRQQLENEFVVAGAYRNGMLAYRPSFREGKLVRSSEQEWAKNLQLGSHRLKESWLKDRFSWLDEDGVPVKADWSESSAKRLEAMEEVSMTPEGPEFEEDYVVTLGGQEITVPVVNVFGWEELSCVDKADLPQFLHPRERRRRACLEKIGRQKIRRKIMGKRKYWEDLEGRAQALQDEKQVHQEGWTDYLALMLKNHSAQEILRKFVIPKFTGKTRKGKQAAAAKAFRQDQKNKLKKKLRKPKNNLDKL